MFFDRNEIRIQVFEEIPTAKLMSGDSSSLTLCFPDSIIYNYQKKSGNLNFENSKNGHMGFPRFRKLRKYQF